MEPIERDVLQCHALVIDGNPISRSVMTQNLREFGFGAVKAVSRIVDAREALEHRRFDMVICDHNFEQGHESGQDLLEELRREQLLPYATVFIMVTGEATYQTVAEAAEAALDSYLIKPFSANTLFTRVREARQRKRVLQEVFEAMEARDLEHAAALCIQRFEQREMYWLYAARIGAELLLNLKRHDEAKQLYDAVVAAKAVPWARLGIARVQLVDGDTSQAKRSLEALISDTPQYADSYDVMGKLQMEQGQIAQALETYRTAAEMTPGCILRLQHCGTLAFYSGDAPTCIKMLERTWTMGAKSRLFDVLSAMLLAFMRFDARDSKGLAISQEIIERFATNYPQSVRLRRMKEIADLLCGLLSGQVAHHVLKAREQIDQIARPDFDMEAATNVLSLWARLGQFGVETPEMQEVVTRIASRFCISKATTEVLAAAMRTNEPAQGWIREAQAAVLKLAETAMNHAMRGEPKTAVQALLAQGEMWGNAKLIEMAGLVARRHQERISDVQPLLDAATALSHRYCAPASHIAGVRRSNRSAGGMVLRR